MELTDLALLARKRGDRDVAHKYFYEAFLLERTAAEVFRGKPEFEPTRTILYRSAANLALDIGDSAEAERLAHMALTGNPPPELREELWSLLDQIRTLRHQGAQMTERGLTQAEVEESRKQ